MSFPPILSRVTNSSFMKYHDNIEIRGSIRFGYNETIFLGKNQQNDKIESKLEKFYVTCVFNITISYHITCESELLVSVFERGYPSNDVIQYLLVINAYI